MSDGTSGTSEADRGSESSGDAPEIESLRTGSSRLAAKIAAPIGVVLIALIALLATRDPHQREIDNLLLGQPAPAVVGETIDGAAFDLDDQRGRWVVVNFFATWCIPCIEEHPDLVAFSETRQDASLVSIAFGDTPRNVADFFDQRGGDWPVLASGVDTAGVDWGVVAVPESYLVSPSGIVAHKFVGGVTLQDLENAIASFGPGTSSS